jgi:hypothetical protein
VADASGICTFAGPGSDASFGSCRKRRRARRAPFGPATDARDPELLALVTADVAGDVAEVQVVKQVEFWESNPYSGDGTERPYATGLVFASKDAAQDSAAYIEEDLSEATYWHGAYVFEGDDYPL